jgi:hypothetical protein
MKRILTLIILGHWLLFFVLHSFGALAGSLTLATMSGLSNAVAAFGANGAIRALPLVSAGMGTASLLVATLFLWALLSNLLGSQPEEGDGEVEKIAFGGAALVFTMLSALSIIDADPSTLLASTGYFVALLLSWLACKAEAFETVLPLESIAKSVSQAPAGNSVARAMASSAAHTNLLAKIAGRERN